MPVIYGVATCATNKGDKRITVIKQNAGNKFMYSVDGKNFQTFDPSVSGGKSVEVDFTIMPSDNLISADADLLLTADGDTGSEISEFLESVVKTSDLYKSTGTARIGFFPGHINISNTSIQLIPEITLIALGETYFKPSDREYSKSIILGANSCKLVGLDFSGIDENDNGSVPFIKGSISEIKDCHFTNWSKLALTNAIQVESNCEIRNCQFIQPKGLLDLATPAPIKINKAGITVSLIDSEINIQTGAGSAIDSPVAATLVLKNTSIKGLSIINTSLVVNLIASDCEFESSNLAHDYLALTSTAGVIKIFNSSFNSLTSLKIFNRNIEVASEISGCVFRGFGISIDLGNSGTISNSSIIDVPADSSVSIKAANVIGVISDYIASPFEITAKVIKDCNIISQHSVKFIMSAFIQSTVVEAYYSSYSSGFFISGSGMVSSLNATLHLTGNVTSDPAISGKISVIDSAIDVRNNLCQLVSVTDSSCMISNLNINLTNLMTDVDSNYSIPVSVTSLFNVRQISRLNVIGSSKPLIFGATTKLFDWNVASENLLLSNILIDIPITVASNLISKSMVADGVDLGLILISADNATLFTELSNVNNLHINKIDCNNHTMMLASSVGFWDNVRIDSVINASDSSKVGALISGNSDYSELNNFSVKMSEWYRSVILNVFKVSNSFISIDSPTLQWMENPTARAINPDQWGQVSNVVVQYQNNSNETIVVSLTENRINIKGGSSAELLSSLQYTHSNYSKVEISGTISLIASEGIVFEKNVDLTNLRFSVELDARAASPVIIFDGYTVTGLKLNLEGGSGASSVINCHSPLLQGVDGHLRDCQITHSGYVKFTSSNGDYRSMILCSNISNLIISASNADARLSAAPLIECDSIIEDSNIVGPNSVIDSGNGAIMVQAKSIINCSVENPYLGGFGTVVKADLIDNCLITGGGRESIQMPLTAAAQSRLLNSTINALGASAVLTDVTMLSHNSNSSLIIQNCQFNNPYDPGGSSNLAIVRIKSGALESKAVKALIQNCTMVSTILTNASTINAVDISSMGSDNVIVMDNCVVDPGITLESVGDNFIQNNITRTKMLV